MTHNFIEKCKKYKGKLSTILILDSGIPENIELKKKIDYKNSKNLFESPYFEKYCLDKNYLFNDKKKKYTQESEIDFYDHETNILSVISSDYLGTSPESKIISCKILNKHGKAPIGFILEGLIYANKINPDIVNISSGYSLRDITRSQDYQIHDRINEEVIKLYNKNILIVCSKKEYDSGFYPADFNQTISVIEFNKGKENIGDIIYDKKNFFVNSKKNEFTIKSGSSLMTGFISGILSNYITYLKSNNKEINVKKIKKELIKNQESLSELHCPNITLTEMSDAKIEAVIQSMSM
jgi:hypothetical protein